MLFAARKVRTVRQNALGASAPLRQSPGSGRAARSARGRKQLSEAHAMQCHRLQATHTASIRAAHHDGYGALGHADEAQLP